MTCSGISSRRLGLRRKQHGYICGALEDFFPADELKYYMLGPILVAFRVLRYFLVLSVMIVTWLVLGMVYLDRFVEPLDRLKPVLMPWREPESDEATAEERLALMQRQLVSSKKTANYSFFVMGAHLRSSAFI